MTIILASTSPRRRELIKKLGVDFECVSPGCDEDIDCTDPAQAAEALAERKALSVSGDIVIGADTVVALDGRMFGKPDGADDALRMLRALCGRTHEVVTGVCVVCGGKKAVASEVTRVTFKPYDETAVSSYIQSGKCFGKAGAYGLQDGEIQALTEKVDGDTDNVIGLPVRLVKKMLDEMGLEPLIKFEEQ